MTDTFTWPLTNETGGGAKFNVARAQYGDGYAQKSPAGLNSKVQEWNVTFVGYKPEALEMLAFIDDKLGSESFFWTPPLGVQGYYTCESYDIKNIGGTFYTISLIFQQDFKP